MDIRMPGCDGLEATRRHRRRRRAAAVLILTTFDLDEYVFEALRAGASGFLLKDAPPERAGRTRSGVVAAGDALLAPSITRRLIEQFARRPRPAAAAARRSTTLTQREREVLRLVARGLSQRRDRRRAVRRRGARSRRTSRAS